MKSKEIGNFLGQLVSFRDALKLHHWKITGPSSYAIHMALDQAVDGVSESSDGLIETSYAVYGDIDIVIPETKNPKNIILFAENFYKHLDEKRNLFTEDFQKAFFDDLQQVVQQLLYRLKRLK